MQLSMFDNTDGATKRVPAIVLKIVNSDYIAIRFRQIGNPQRFNIILGRFRYDFPLANCQEIEGQPWWVLTSSQYDDTEAFAKRNGLELVKE